MNAGEQFIVNNVIGYLQVDTERLDVERCRTDANVFCWCSLA